MSTTQKLTIFIIIFISLFDCEDRGPINPLDPENPNTKGQEYSMTAEIAGIRRVKLQWKKINQTEVKRYRIYRKSEGGIISPIAEVTDNLFYDTHLQSNTIYNYFYRLVWSDGRELHQSPTANIQTFNAPTGFEVSQVTRNHIEMHWDDLHWLDNYARCRIYRGTGTSFSLYDSTSSNQYIDTVVDTGITYRYKIVAVANDGSRSNLSNEIYATPGNSAPVIDSIQLSQPITGWGEEVTITCLASDADGDSIHYLWQALDGGSVSGSGKTITFLVPQDTLLTHRVMVTISDNYSSGSNDTVSIESFQIPTQGLVAYYPFNGNANDESGNGNNGMVYGATLVADRFGNANSAYSFDGIDDKIVTNKKHFANNNNLSISLWVKLIVNQELRYFVMCSDFGIWSSWQDIGIAISLPLTNSAGGFTGIGYWAHFVGTYDGTLIKAYINGELKGVTSWPGNLSDPGRVLTFGNFDTGVYNYFWKGVIDEVCIYNRALTDQEIQILWQEGRAQ